MCSAFRRSLAAALAIAAAVTACSRADAPPPAPQAAVRVLRVCADPNNLPFSNAQREGFENRIASLVAGQMHADLEYVWWAQRRGFIRNTLRAGLCDAVMGLPERMPMAATTRPYYRSAYVFVTPQGAPQPASFDDPLLKHARIGVHLIGDDFANSPPAHALSTRGLIENVRGYSIYGDYKLPNPPAALIDAVSNGEVDVAVAWGPLAGFFARTSPVPLQLRRVTPDEEPPFPFVFNIAMGVERSNTALRDELNQIIIANRSSIDRILQEFNVPTLHPSTVASR